MPDAERRSIRKQGCHESSIQLALLTCIHDDRVLGVASNPRPVVNRLGPAIVLDNEPEWRIVNFGRQPFKTRLPFTIGTDLKFHFFYAEKTVSDPDRNLGIVKRMVELLANGKVYAASS